MAESTAPPPKTGSGGFIAAIVVMLLLGGALVFWKMRGQDKKVVDGQPRTDYAQYRALVTVVHTDQGWLVSSIDTQ